MKFETHVGEQGQVILPQEIRDHLGLDTNSAIEFEIAGKTVALAPSFDRAKFEKGIAKWAGSQREEMLAEGYASTDELMKDIRGR